MLYGENKMFPSADLSLSYGASAKSLCPRKPWAARMPGQMPVGKVGQRKKVSWATCAVSDLLGQIKHEK